MKKRKCAAGGVVVGPRSMQDQLIAIRPKFADGGKVDAAEEAMRRMASKYGTSVPPPTPQAAVAQPSAPATATAQPTERGLSSLPSQIQQRTDELQRVMGYDKRRGMAAGGIPGIDEPVSLAGPAPFRQDIGAGVGATSLQSGNLSGLPSATGMTPQSQGFLGAADYSTGPKQTGFTWDDGTRRDGLTPEQAQRQDAQAIAAPVPSATEAPLMTMAEKQIAAGINPNAAYRPGGPGDPHASGGLAATAQQRAALPDATQAQPMPSMPANPMDSPSRRSRGRQQFADGGSVYPQERKPRDDYEVPKTFMGHVQKIGGLVGRMVDEIRNPVQHAQTQSSPLDVEAQIMKRAHANAQARDSYADGGMVKFAGKGGPREDKIPVKVAGESIRVSNGESAVILPAKTAANPQAVQAIGQVIQQSNDGRAPDMGGKRFERGGFPVRQVPDEIDLARGQLETARAQAADNASRSAYKAELATRDAMTARAAESANMQAALDGAKSQPAINPKALPAQPIYQPNWTAGNNSPVLEGVVETADEVRAKSATPPRQAIGAPQPGTAVTPRAVDWTPGGNPPAGGPVQARSVDWTYGQNGGPAQQPGMAAQAARPVQQISGPQEAIQADPRTMSRTAAAARSRGAMSPEAAAFEAARTAEPAAAASRPVGMAQQAIGKVGKYLAPVAKFATAADIAANAYNSGRDGGAIQLAPSEQQTGDYANQGGLARFASAAKHGLTAGMLNVGDAAAGVIDGAAGLPNLILPKNAQIPSVQQIYRQQAQDTFRPGGVGGEHGTVTIREDQRMPQNAVAQQAPGRSAINAPVDDYQAQQTIADPRIAATTGNAGNAKFNPDTGTLTFTKPGLDVTKQQVADGTGMISRANGQTQVIANMSPNQYTAADGTQNARWEQTQAYLDAQQRLQADKARAAEMQATRQGMNPVQAIAATQGMAQAAQRAPLERGVIQQQIETGKVAAQNAKELQDLYALHKASVDPAEQERIAEQIRIRTGTYKPEEFAHAAGGTTINPATMGVEKTPDVIYSKRTGKPVSSTAVASKAFSKSDVDAAIGAGASKEAVAARIKSMGMNPKDYGL